MSYRNLPNSDVARIRAIRFLLKAYQVYVTNIALEPSKIRAISDAYQIVLKTKGELFIAEVESRNFALTDQGTATTEKDAALIVLRKVNTHFIIVLNLAIDRNVYPATIRSSYGLDIISDAVPPMGREAEVYDWAQRLISAETHRIAAGGLPMKNPSLEDLQRAFDTFDPLRDVQQIKKTKFDLEQEEVANLRAEIDEILKDGWDQVEFYFRKDKPASLRRKARAWGMDYISRPDEEPEPESEVFTGIVKAASIVEIMHNGFDVNTMFIAKNPGPVPIDLYTAASAGDPLPGTRITIAPGIETEVWASELGADSNTYLMAYNPHATIEGSYVIVLGNPE
jgi:hypothetical protein